MSPITFLFLFLFTLSTISFSLTFSRTIEHFSTTQLDVSSSLHQTTQVLSFISGFLEEEQATTHTTTPRDYTSPFSSSFSVQLHPRDSLLNAQHQDYTSLVHSRLARDSARVKSITAKLNLVLNQVHNSDLYPTQSEISPQDLSTPISSGTKVGSGEYFSRVGVGHPSRPMFMVLDTGSDVNWVQCMPCTDCYNQTDPVFDPAYSSSYSPLTCSSQQCQQLETSACRNNRCLYQVSYGDGSFTVGDFATETVSFGKYL